jgi:hypothetical protein
MAINAPPGTGVARLVQFRVPTLKHAEPRGAVAVHGAFAHAGRDGRVVYACDCAR